MLHDPQYKAKAKQVGAALSPWKEMVGPVDRSFQSIGHDCGYMCIFNEDEAGIINWS